VVIYTILTLSRIPLTLFNVLIANFVINVTIQPGFLTASIWISVKIALIQAFVITAMVLTIYSGVFWPRRKNIVS
jgi:hypothetical protein